MVAGLIQLLDLLVDILRTWDLDTATAGRVRRHLEEDFQVDLSKSTYTCTRIQERIDNLFNDGKEDVYESKGSSTKTKRKRKAPEICTVSPILQGIVGGESEMARSGAVKKVVAYAKEKGLVWGNKASTAIDVDDKLDALFPDIKRQIVNILHIDHLLLRYEHLQPLSKDDGKARKRKTTRNKVANVGKDVGGTRKRTRNNTKRNINLELAEEDVRPWDTMPKLIMVKILKLLPFPYWIFYPCYVCRSWQLAAADVMFPPEKKVLDLRVLDSYPWKSRKGVLLLYLRIVLNSQPAIPWETLYLPEKTAFCLSPSANIINNQVLTWIAEMTPELRNLSKPRKMREDVSLEWVAPKWKNLRKVDIDISADNLFHLQANCSFISELCLYGESMDDDKASLLAKSFPNLKSLEINWSTLSDHMLRVIRDGHKNLKLLGMLTKTRYIDGHKVVELPSLNLRRTYYRFETPVAATSLPESDILIVR